MRRKNRRGGGELEHMGDPGVDGRLEYVAMIHTYARSRQVTIIQVQYIYTYRIYTNKVPFGSENGPKLSKQKYQQNFLSMSFFE